MLLSQQEKKGVTVFGGVINPDYQGNLAYYSTVEVRKSMLNIGDHLVYALVSSGPVIKSMETIKTLSRQDYY
jgi:dUTPase